MARFTYILFCNLKEMHLAFGLFEVSPSGFISSVIPVELNKHMYVASMVIDLGLALVE